MVGVAACGGGGGGDEGDSCGPGMECRSDLVCDPISHTCQRRGQSADAGIDAAELVDTTIGTTPPAVTQGASAAFTFASNAAGATFECRVDGGAFTPCTSPINYTGLSEGPHTFEVRATARGVTDPTPAAFTWVIDQTAPTPVVAAPQNGATVCPTVAISLATDPPETGVTYQCGLDAAALAACSPPSVSYSGLAAGSHAVHVVATDQAGNASTPLTVTFTVDDAPPVIDTKSFAATPGPINSGAATFTFAAADPNGLMGAQAGLTFGPSPFPDPTDTSMCTCQATSAAAASCACTQLAAGANFVAVRATDTCGKTSAFAVTQATTTFGPYDGHAVVIGHDYTAAGTPAQLVRGAVTLVPLRHRSLSTRPLRLLGFTAGNPDLAGAKAALGDLILAPNAYAELTDYTLLGTALPGRDALIVYDLNLFPGDAFLGGVAVAWATQLHNFLDAGGVVVVLTGTTTTANGTFATGTHEILAGGRQPIMNGLGVTTVTGNVTPFRAAYPYPQPFGPSTLQPYWLVRPAAFTYGPPALPAGTAGFDTIFTFNQVPQVLDIGAALVYEAAYDACGDGCIRDFPLVLDKVFPDSRIHVAVDLPSQGRTGPTGTGTFQVNVAGVPRSGFTCYLHPFPSYPTSETVPPLACTITSSPADTQMGAFSFDASARGESEWIAVITRLDATGEPATPGMTAFSVDNSVFLYFSPQPSQHDAQTPWLTSPSEYLASLTCRLYYHPTVRPDPSNCAPPCMLVATRTDAGCGGVLVPGTPYYQGTGTVNWTGSFLSISGVYTARMDEVDVFGNRNSADTVGWSYP